MICPEYQPLKYSTTNRDGYRVYKSDPNICASCPTRDLCTHSKDCVKTVQRHIWKDYEELADDARYTPKYQELYKRRKLSRRAAENERLADTIEKIHEESPDKGYRRLNDDLRHDHGIHVNGKRVLRICRIRDIRSTIKYSDRGCTRQAKNPQYLAENLLNRQFYAAKPNEKWLTDVTEFKWYEGNTVHKLVQAGMTQSMSRVAHCIDNGPMEGFWGILKRERYYGRRFTSKRGIVQMIQQYIRYYNTRRVQRNLGVLTPMEKHAICLAA